MCLHKAKHGFCVPLVYFCSEVWGRGQWVSLMCTQAPESCFALFLLCSWLSKEFVSPRRVMCDHSSASPGLTRALGVFYGSILEGACSVIMRSPSVFFGIFFFIQGRRHCKNHFEVPIMWRKHTFL